MTFNPLDAEDINIRSGLIGQELNFHHTLPDTIQTTTSGGGNVSASNNGASISPGTSAGDIAAIQGADAFLGDWNGTYTRHIYFFPNEVQDDFVDAADVGGTSKTVGSSDGAYFDMLNEQYVVAGTTAPGPDPQGTNRSVLTIEVDKNNGETTFTLRGGVTDETTITTTPTSLGPYLVTTESNGEGDNVGLKYAVDIPHPE